MEEDNGSPRLVRTPPFSLKSSSSDDEDEDNGDDADDDNDAEDETKTGDIQRLSRFSRPPLENDDDDDEDILSYCIVFASLYYANHPRSLFSG